MTWRKSLAKLEYDFKKKIIMVMNTLVMLYIRSQLALNVKKR